MADKRQALRERILQFNETHSKAETVHHFTEEGVPRRTVYNVLSRGTAERKHGSGRKATIMTAARILWLRQRANNRIDFSSRQVARKLDCSDGYVRETLRNIGLKNYKQQRAPAYDETKLPLLKSQCRWMRDRYRTELFVLDDEKYFTLTAPTGGRFYTENKETAPPAVRYKGKAKFEKKVLVYLVASCRGISKPFIAVSGLAVNQDVYVDRCLRRILVPFIREKHADNNYVFWPDKASSHYGKKTLEFLAQERINFVPKLYNPTNLPQCRPIEDLWGTLTGLVYKNGWAAKTVPQLIRRIKQCVKKLDLNAVNRAFSPIRKKIALVYRKGPYPAVH